MQNILILQRFVRIENVTAKATGRRITTFKFVRWNKDNHYVGRIIWQVRYEKGSKRSRYDDLNIQYIKEELAVWYQKN